MGCNILESIKKCSSKYFPKQERQTILEKKCAACDKIHFQSLDICKECEMKMTDVDIGKKWKMNKEENLDVCSICIENITEDEIILTLNCNHSFHEECIKFWFAKKLSCPLCDTDI